MGSNGKMDSKPEMGTRSHTDFNANSGVVAEMPNKGIKESVREAKLDMGAQKAALARREKAEDQPNEKK